MAIEAQGILLTFFESGMTFDALALILGMGLGQAAGHDHFFDRLLIEDRRHQKNGQACDHG